MLNGKGLLFHVTYRSIYIQYLSLHFEVAFPAVTVFRPSFFVFVFCFRFLFLFLYVLSQTE